MGQEIEHKGYSFERLYDSATLFWEIFLREKLNVSAVHVQLTDQETLDRNIEQNKLVEKETLYPLLPASLQEQFSLQDLVDKYAVSREAFQLALSEKHDVLVGCYNSGKDRCYVLRHCRHPDVIYGDKERTTIAVHELTHRWLHYQWQNLPSLQGKLWVADANDEESLCDDVEVFFSGTTFGNYGDSEIKIFSERIAEGVANATNPQRIFLFTKSRIKYYGRLLRE